MASLETRKVSKMRRWFWRCDSHFDESPAIESEGGLAMSRVWDGRPKVAGPKVWGFWGAV